MWPFFKPHIKEIKLEKALYGLEKPGISLKKRKHLFNKIQLNVANKTQKEFLPSRYMALVNKLHNLADVTVPSTKFRADLQEKLFGIISRKPMGLFNFHPFLFSRKVFTFAVLVLFSVASFFSFFGSTQRVFAAPMSYLQEINGEVVVIRRGEEMSAVKNFRLRQNDIVRTSDNSGVTIRFLDDSVSRLAQNSSMKIERLFLDEQDYTETSVSINLLSGRLYAYVLNLVNTTSSFEVKAKSVTAVARKKSTFDILISGDGKTKISSLKHAVDVQVAKNTKPVVETTLTTGFSIEVDDGNAKVESPKTRNIPENDSWIADNLVRDREYTQELMEAYRSERKEKAPSAPLIVFDDMKKEEARLSAATAKLIQAESLFMSGHADEAQSLLQEFEEIIVEIADKGNLWKEKNPEKSRALRAEITQILNRYKKQFALVLPDDPLYPLKERLFVADVAVSDDMLEKREKKLANAEEKLIEASSLQEQGESELAAKQVQAYAEQLSQVSEEIDNLPSSEKKEAVDSLLGKQEFHLKILGALSQTAKLQTPPTLRPGETRGINLREILVQATRESLQPVSSFAETNDKTKNIGAVNVNGAPIPSVQAQPEQLNAIEKEPVEIAPEKSVKEISPDFLSGVTVISIDAVAPKVEVESVK